MNHKNNRVNACRRLLTPTLTLSAVALGASAAHGAVVATNFPDVTTTGAGRGIYVIFNTTTGVIFTSEGNTSMEVFQFGASGYYSGKGGSGWSQAQVPSVSYRANIAAPSFALGATVDLTANFLYTIDLPSNLTDAYFGVRLGVSGDYHYGWIQISTGADAGGGKGPGSVTVQAAAIETTANTGMTITSAVPEPSSALLLGLAAGAGAFRRRRSQAA